MLYVYEKLTFKFNLLPSPSPSPISSSGNSQTVFSVSPQQNQTQTSFMGSSCSGAHLDFHDQRGPDVDVQNVIVIWDFDKSLSNCSTDYYLFKKCGIVDQLKNKMKEDKEKISARFDDNSKNHNTDGEKSDQLQQICRYSFINTFNEWAFDQLFLPNGTKKPRLNKDEMHQLFMDAPYDENNIKIVNTLHEFETNNDNDCAISQVIVSWGNSLFIEAACKRYNLESKIDEIISNKSQWTPKWAPYNFLWYETILSQPYLSESEIPYHCNQYKLGLCAPFMCKGDVVCKKILPKYANSDSESNYQNTIIIYVGDGTGDYCPLTKLRKNKDFGFVRTSNGDNKNCQYKLHQLIKSSQNNDSNNYYNADMSIADKIEANLLYWQNGQDLIQCFKKALPFIKFNFV